MTSFGIIGEGVTDQKVLENILLGVFEEQQEEPFINYVQPPFDATGKKNAPAGWGLVFSCLKQGAHKEALQFNDYVIIQIDTDISDDYGVPKHNGERELAPSELVDKVIEKLVDSIGAEFYESYADRFIFAVAVHAIECWLLPLFYDNKKRAKVSGCKEAVNQELRKRNEKPLSTGENKFPLRYDEVSRPYRRAKKLTSLCDTNPSLGIFVAQLRTKNIRLVPSP